VTVENCVCVSKTATGPLSGLSIVGETVRSRGICYLNGTALRGRGGATYQTRVFEGNVFGTGTTTLGPTPTVWESGRVKLYPTLPRAHRCEAARS